MDTRPPVVPGIFGLYVNRDGGGCRPRTQLESAGPTRVGQRWSRMNDGWEPLRGCGYAGFAMDSACSRLSSIWCASLACFWALLTISSSVSPFTKKPQGQLMTFFIGIPFVKYIRINRL